MPSQQDLQYIATGAQKRNLDPLAVLAVASTEGLGGGIGDNGHAFGPFQLNDAGGAFPSNVNGQTTAGWSTDQRQAWAWSPAGIDYALNRIAAVASGQRGPQAIVSIVTRFERPANPGAEISKATSRYRNPDQLGQAILAAGRGSITDTPSKVADAGKNAADQVKSVAEAPVKVAEFLGKLVDPHNLLRAGQVVAGAVLVLLGVYLLARQVGLASVAGQVKGALPQPAVDQATLNQQAYERGVKQGQTAASLREGRKQGASSIASRETIVTGPQPVYTEPRRPRRRSSAQPSEEIPF